MKSVCTAEDDLGDGAWKRGELFLEGGVLGLTRGKYFHFSIR